MEALVALEVGAIGPFKILEPTREGSDVDG